LALAGCAWPATPPPKVPQGPRLDDELVRESLSGVQQTLSADVDTAALFDLQHQKMLFEHHPIAFRQHAVEVGSVVKLLATYTLLTTSPKAEAFEHTCRGLPPRKPGQRRGRGCWLHAGHGPMRLTTALMNSCNAYYYAASKQTSAPALLDVIRQFGLHQPAALPGAPCAPNQVPTTVSAGDFPDLFIGDHRQLKFTPASLLQLVATVAERPLPSSNTDVLDANALQALRQGMCGVCEAGTLEHIFEGVGVAAKTGTAEQQTRLPSHELDIDDPTRTRGVVIGFAPADQPRFAFVVVKSNGRGARDAGPVARAMVQAGFDAMEQAGLQVPGRSA